jgi:signal transduction histidine kinase
VRLQSQLTIAFALVALVPILVLGAVARLVVVNQSRATFEHALDAEVATVEREAQRLRDEVSAAVARVAKPDHPFTAALLVALARGPLDEDAERDLAARAGGEMAALGLDVLLVLDGNGQVLAAPHHRGQVGDRDGEALALARAGGGSVDLTRMAMMVGGRVERRLVVATGREVVGAAPGPDGARPRVALVGGRLLGTAFVERLHPSARLLDASGALVAGPQSPPPSVRPSRTVEIARKDGTVAARVQLAIADDELRRTLELVTMATIGLGLAGLALALLAGALLARRFTHPLEELAEAAGRLARGDLDAEVRVRGGGPFATRDEVAALGVAWNRMVADLRTARDELVRAERIAAWREIAQRIAHEIKNPLTPIQMAIETLQRAHGRRASDERAAALFDELFAESATTILGEVKRLAHIVSEFSRFARMPAPALAALDINSVVESALGLYVGTSVTVRRALAPGLPPVLADRDQMTQVLVNLLENARDAVAESPSGGTVEVETRLDGGEVALTVRDDGPGIPEEVRAKIFVPYFTTKAKGTGLGLAIVHRIVTDHGGSIAVESAPGKGAAFVIRLPVASAAATAS